MHDNINELVTPLLILFMSICEGLFTTLDYVLDYVEHQHSALPPPPPPEKTKQKQNKTKKNSL